MKQKQAKLGTLADMSSKFHKMKIRQIISGHVITVPPGALVADALDSMASNRISCLVIAEDNKPLGIFTERDVVRVANRAGSLP